MSLRLFGDGLFSTTGDGTIDRRTLLTKNSNFKPRSMIGLVVLSMLSCLVRLSNWVAAVANTVDNFDMLGESALENAFPKLSFILAAALTDPAGISALRPLVEMLSGNEFAMNRFAAGQINSLGPLAGARNEVGKILDGGLKDYNNIIDQLHNRNRFIGLVDETNRLPTVISPIAVKLLINIVSYNVPGTHNLL